jgi:hypothetical protein
VVEISVWNLEFNQSFHCEHFTEQAFEKSRETYSCDVKDVPHNPVLSGLIELPLDGFVPFVGVRIMLCRID